MLSAYVSTILLGLLIFLAISFAPSTVRGAPLVSCYTTILLLLAIYFFLPAMSLLVLRDGRYVWVDGYGIGDIALTSVVCILALVAFVLGYAYAARFRSPRAVISVPMPRVGHEGVVIAWVLIGAGIAAKLYLLFVAGGFEESVIRLSSGIRKSLKMDDEISTIGTAIRYLSSAADAATIWLLLRGMYRKNLNIALVIVFLAVIVLSFMGTGKRLYVVWPIVCAVLGYHFYMRPLKVKNLPVAVIGILLIGFGSLMFRIFLPATFAGANIDLYRVPWAEGSIIKFYLLSLEFGSFEILTFDIYNSDLLIGMFGGLVEAFYITNIEPLSFFVPRAIWPSKPEIMLDLAHANRAAILGGGLTAGGGINSTLLGTAWTFAGPLGLAVSMGALGAFASLVDRGKSVCGIPSPARIVLYGFWIVVCFQFFRQGTIGWTVIITVYQQIGAIAAFIILVALDPLEKEQRLISLPRGKHRTPKKRDASQAASSAARHRA
jgi:hypothetical protein